MSQAAWLLTLGKCVFLISVIVECGRVSAQAPFPIDERREIHFFPHKAPDPKNWAEYEAYKAEAKRQGMTPGLQRTLDEYAAKVVFTLPLPPEVVSPDSDGVALREAIAWAERVHIAKLRDNDVVNSGGGDFKYAEKPDVKQYKIALRIYEDIHEAADDDWLTTSDKAYLDAQLTKGKEGLERLRRALIEVRLRRTLEVNRRHYERITDFENTRHIQKGELPLYTHPFLKSTIAAIDRWKLSILD